MKKDINIIIEDSFETWFLNRYTQEIIDLIAAYDASLISLAQPDHKEALRLLRDFKSEISRLANMPLVVDCERNPINQWTNQFRPRTSKLRATNMVLAATNYLASKYRSEGGRTVYPIMEVIELIASPLPDNGLSTRFVSVGDSGTWKLDDFIAELDILSFDELLELNTKLGMQVLIFTETKYPRDHSLRPLDFSK